MLSKIQTFSFKISDSLETVVTRNLLGCILFLQIHRNKSYKLLQDFCINITITFLWSSRSRDFSTVAIYTPVLLFSLVALHRHEKAIFVTCWCEKTRVRLGLALDKSCRDKNQKIKNQVNFKQFLDSTIKRKV